MAAILFSQHPDWNGNQVLRTLINTANKPNDGSAHNDYVGFGSASVSKAIKYTGDPGPADVNPLIQAGVSVTPPPSDFLPGTASSASPSTASAQPSAPASGAAPVGNSPAPGGAPTKSTVSSSSSGSNLPLIVGGAVLAVLIVGGVIFFKGRRKRSAVAPDDAQSPSYPVPAQQQPYGPGTPPPGYAPGTPPPPAQSPSPYQTPPPPAANPYRDPQS
jgi:hypothetical protein